MALRRRQEEILRFIERFLDERGYPPTIRDIQHACDISSTSVVDYNLRALERASLIRRSPEVSRGIELTTRRLRTVRVPVLGTIAAGEPLPTFPASPEAVAEEDTVEVAAELARGKERLYALRVKGDSMIDALVRDGDVVVLQAQETAEPGDMVAAWLVSQEETTLKRFHPEGRRVRLQPENRSMQPIYVDARNVQVKGRVVGVVRQYG
ncbi:MAG: transcriptional repressor LexA [Chloroflexi bacterium]|nr:transcriptional repressor LexA [Chloroflexota bacterium]